MLRKVFEESNSLVSHAHDISVVIRTVGGGPFVKRALRALLPQIDDHCEVIVPYDATVRDEMRDVQRELPMFRFVDLGQLETVAPPRSGAADHERYDRRTSAGFCRAQGQIVVSLEDYGVPADDWIEQIRLSHRLPHGVIGGCVEQASDRLLNWAVYYLDFGRFQPPLKEGPAQYLTDVNVSYKRDVLRPVEDLWQERYNEAKLHWELQRRGVTLWSRPQIVVTQDRGELTWSGVLRERYCWGRLFGAVRAQNNNIAFRIIYALLSPFIPFVLVARRAVKVLTNRQNAGRFFVALPAFFLLAVVWCFGEFMGYVSGRADSGESGDARRN